MNYTVERNKKAGPKMMFDTLVCGDTTDCDTEPVTPTFEIFRGSGPLCWELLASE